MARTGIHLQYAFEPAGQEGADIHNPLFDVLAAVQEQGSIRYAAAALGHSYRHTWGVLKHWEGVFGQPLLQWAQGRRACLSPFGQRILWAERQARVRMRPHIEALRVELQHALALAADPQLRVLEVFASHDLGLPLLQAQCAAQQLHLGLRFVGSEEALLHLNRGRCQVAGFHVPRLSEFNSKSAPTSFAAALRPLLRPGLHKLIGSHLRVQGLMSRKGEVAPRSLGDVVRLRLRFAHRQPGSGTRLLCEYLLQAEGIDPRSMAGQGGRVEDTHVAVAAAVAAGQADVGLGVQAAAREFGLHFTPLANEDYFLVCLKEALDSPAVKHLRTVLGAPAWADALHTLEGYGPQRSGEVLSLTKALPWWVYPRSKTTVAEHSAQIIVLPR
jgi:putative molybdopterin biosynthesis protein